jgi:hypothetical protein
MSTTIKKSPYSYPADVVDRLIELDHLHPSQRMDWPAVHAAALDALRAYVGRGVPPPPPPSLPENPRAFEVSSVAASRSHDLLFEQLFVNMVQRGLLTAHNAICMVNDVIIRADKERADEGVRQSAYWLRRSLEFTLRQEGLL